MNPVTTLFKNYYKCIEYYITSIYNIVIKNTNK